MKRYLRDIVVIIIAVLVAVQFTGGEKLQVSESVFDRVMRTKTLRCGYFLEAPLTIKDSNSDELSGIVVDLTEKLAKDWGVEVEWAEEINASTMIEGLNTNRYDMLCASIWQITSRTAHIDHSIPYIYTPIGAYTRIDDNRFDGDLAKVNDKKNKIVGIDGDGAFILAKKRFPNAEITLLPQFSNHSEMLMNVADGKADIAFSILPIFEGYNKNNPNRLKNITKDEPFYAMGNSFAFKRGEFALKSMVDTSIDTYIQSGELDDIINKWDEKNQLYKVGKPYKG